MNPSNLRSLNRASRLTTRPRSRSPSPNNISGALPRITLTASDDNLAARGDEAVVSASRNINLDDKDIIIHGTGSGEGAHHNDAAAADGDVRMRAQSQPLPSPRHVGFDLGPAAPDVLRVCNEMQRLPPTDGISPPTIEVNPSNGGAATAVDDEIDVLQHSDASAGSSYAGLSTSFAVGSPDLRTANAHQPPHSILINHGHNTGGLRRNESIATHLLNAAPGHKYTPHMEDCLRRKLKFHFMDPVQKFKARKEVPWKLIVQVIKIVLVTIQLILFGTSRFNHITFVETNTVAFRHLFLYGWDATREPQAYPPSTGKYALYTTDAFYKHVNYAVSQYYNIKQLAIGSYDFTNLTTTQPVRLCRQHYKKGVVWPANCSYQYDSTVLTECYDIAENATVAPSSMLDTWMNTNNVTIDFDSTIRVTVHMSVRTVHLKTLEPTDTPDCYQFDLTILYDNSGHNGQLPVTLTVAETKLACHGNIKYQSDEQLENFGNLACNVIVILISSLSFILCSRALYRAQRLRRATDKFFRNYYNKKLTWNEKVEFLNIWYLTIVINDVLIVVGSALKIGIEQKNYDEYDVVAVFLGTGSLLVWIGVLRYLGFFRKYNILIITLKNALPNVLRFTLCAAIIYLGFLICGWIILGPYHAKFRTLSLSSECLFSLINGDDMFATFVELHNSEGSLIWYYSQIYLYAFIALFIYVVLSLFIAVIMDAYETIKEYSESGSFPQNELQVFIHACKDQPGSGLFERSQLRDETEGCGGAGLAACLRGVRALWSAACCCSTSCARDKDSIDESSPLLR